MDEYISKPISKDALLKILERVAHGDFSKNYENEHHTSHKEQIQTATNIQESEKEKIKTPTILVTTSPFLSNYMKNIINDIIIVENIEELTKVLSKNRHAIIVIDENFAQEDDIRFLIKSLKKLEPEKIIVLGDEEVEGADITLTDLKPETIQNAIKKG